MFRDERLCQARHLRLHRQRVQAAGKVGNGVVVAVVITGGKLQLCLRDVAGLGKTDDAVLLIRAPKPRDATGEGQVRDGRRGRLVLFRVCRLLRRGMDAALQSADALVHFRAGDLVHEAVQRSAVLLILLQAIEVLHHDAGVGHGTVCIEDRPAAIRGLALAQVDDVAGVLVQVLRQVAGVDRKRLLVHRDGRAGQRRRLFEGLAVADGTGRNRHG